MILRTIDSLRAQTRRADEIIILADNCTDDTVAIALAAGVSVVETVDNGDGKAGALNALLAEMMQLLDDNDCVLVMDADTMLTERFIEATVTTLFSPSPLGVSARPKPSALRGSHPKRRSLRYRVLEILLLVFGIAVTLAVFMLPLVNLPATWVVVAIDVLAGSLATVGRLIPVRTF